MTTSLAADMDVLKEIPGYKAIMKAILKTQIQLLVEQLCNHTGEESIILTASVNDGSLSHLGSELGKGFLEGREEIKSQFLGFCLKGHHKKKTQEIEQPYQRSNISGPSPRTVMQQQAQKRPRPHPGSVSKSPHFLPFTPQDASFTGMPPLAKRPSMERSRSEEHVSDLPPQPFHSDTMTVPILKSESQDSNTQNISGQTSASIDSGFPPQPLPASLQLSHTQTLGDSSQLGDESNQTDNNDTQGAGANVKVEPGGEDEELEITGVEMGEGLPQANWGQDGAGAMGFGAESADNSLLDQSGDQSGYGPYPVYLSQSFPSIKSGRPPTFSGRTGLHGSVPKGYKQCEICNKVLRTVSMFQHRRMHKRYGNAVPATQSMSTTANFTPRGYKECDICGKILKKVSMFQHKQMHLKKSSGAQQTSSSDASYQGQQVPVRPQLPAKPHIPHGYKECETCGKVLKKMSMFQHRQLHRGIKNHECEFCGKKFTQKTTLNVHRRIHTGEKPYNCIYCGKAFSSNSGVFQHSKICTGTGVIYSDYDQDQQ